MAAVMATATTCPCQELSSVKKAVSPDEYISNAWIKEPGRFTLDPIQQMPD